ncbi:aspartic proteinase-like protein 2 [Cucurbita pepo subsp. pepo]|uniref:aspartic proteinase-like protein 2 n=1 Tax=Cucurbita pepo subsp. pepo TaxID=3664 RepID=UPI000C9D33ED|nr:aspartic proteinase-like protein 2 [Cucurbita pepo subsp. pepo]
MRLFFCLISFLPSFFLTGTVPVSTAAAAAAAFSAHHFPLHRAFPHSPTPHFHSLRARDRLRHSRVLRRLRGGIVDFSVKGSSDQFVGLYYTKVKLGNPQREFNVQIDTGSDILWVNCSPCDGCPQSSGLGIELNLFDTAMSSSARLVSCSDPICSAVPTTTNQCLSQNDNCNYTFQYRDRSATSGFYVTDSMYFDMILGESVIANSSAAIVFGCSIYQYGDLTRTTVALDGIFGFGRGEFSVISQLSSRGITPKVFSHCLKGGENGGGILVLGEILEPSIVYSPLIPSQPHYTLNLQSIAISGQPFPNPTVFSISNAGGTIIDSGTTLAYLVEEVYNWIVSVITSAVSQSTTPTISRGSQCYRVSTSVSEVFPVISFNFEGIASMVLKPEEYLQFDSIEPALRCIGFQKAEDGINILGDLVLKDKIVVYDLARQRVGWANYDCSSSVNVSVTSGKDVFIDGQLSVSSSSRKHFYQLLHIVVVLLIHLKLF